MNKRELIRRADETLRENNVKKPISIPKHVFHISDDEGNGKDFTVKKTDKSVIYTIQDIENIIDACLCVIEDAIRNGDEVSIFGFGALGLKYRQPRSTKNVKDGTDVYIEGHYVPKFTAGKELKMCAKTYELLIADKMNAYIPPDPDDYSEGGE